MPRFTTEETERALDGSGIEVPELESYARTLWEYWEANLDPDLFKQDRSLTNAVNGKTILITGASSGIGRAAAIKLARAGGIPLLVARSIDKLEDVRDEIAQFGGTAYVYSADVSDPDSIDRLVAQVLADHPAVDILVNNAGRSIRRSIALSYDRFHDFERTIQLNYLGAVKLILALLPHMRARKSGHVVNVSSIGVQTSPPRFSAYVASKAALDAFTRVVGSETIADRVTFTTIHMPLVRTPMIAPTKLYNSFPTISPRRPPTSSARRSARSRSRSTPASARSARSPTRSRRRPSTSCCTSRTASSPTRRRRGGRWGATRRPPPSSWPSRTSLAAFTGRRLCAIAPVRRGAWSLPSRPSREPCRRCGLPCKPAGGLADKSTRPATHAAWAPPTSRARAEAALMPTAGLGPVAETMRARAGWEAAG